LRFLREMSACAGMTAFFVLRFSCFLFYICTNHDFYLRYLEIPNFSSNFAPSKKIVGIMNEVIRKIKWTFACFLLVLFCGYMISITCFSHSHIVNGQLVTHSHPYKGTSDNPGHNHTTAQFISISLLSHFVTLGAAFAGLVHILSGKKIILNLSRTFFYKQAQIRSYSLRAPPVF
jgi:hypothetical protein